MDLRLVNIDKFYGDNHVLNDVNLFIPGGEFIVIVGPSGCGKSTLLRVIAGLEKVDSGTIEIAGEVANHVPPAMRNVAMVFQSYALYPHLTVYDNLKFSLGIAGLSETETEARIDEVSRLLGLEDYLERKPSALSGGQR